MNSKKRSGWKHLAAMAVVSGCMSGSEVEEPVVVVDNEEVGKETDSENSRFDFVEGEIACAIARFLSYPTQEVDFVPGSYAGRTFLNPLDHCGEDIQLPEGTLILAIGNGIIKFYGPATGYGELAVVIEHDLGREMSFRNGNGEIVTTRYILSIYGHLRKSETRGGAQLPWHVGDCVEAGEIIGYVNDDLHNGDGGLHLHGGIRLMSAEDAMDRDRNWFRGYDDDEEWRGDFAAMSEVISGILNSVSHHPDGALIKTAEDPDIYLICNGGQKCLVEDERVWRDERFWTEGHPDGEWHKVAIVSDEELDCYPTGEEMGQGVRRRLIECDDGDFLWREDNDNRQRINFNHRSDEYEELVRSWGFDPDEIEEDEWYCEGEESFDPLYLRDGTLVKEEDRSDVYFVTAHGVAEPIISWDLYLAMGYQANDIQVMPSGSLRDLVREIQRDRMIDWEYARTCGTEAGDEGGGGVCAPSAEVCDSADNDCDGEIDEDFDLDWSTDNCGACGNNCHRPHANWHCASGECEFAACDAGWHDLDGNLENGCEYACFVQGPEVCNSIDDDCDGVADEDLFCGEAQVCNPSPETCNGFDDDCDGLVDEGVRNACGDCGQTPAEVCNGQDDDCNGMVDNGVLNACGQCGNVPVESCGNNRDDDCDGVVDEGCGQVCNAIAETCNGSDDDCDGVVDENISRVCATACGNGTQTCGNGVWGTCSARQPSNEVCDGADNDCDGVTDDGVRNACGQCGNVPVEVCDGADNDCDGSIDEAGVCGGCGLSNTVYVQVDSGSDGSHTLWTDLEEAGPDCRPEWESVRDDAWPYEWTYEGDNGPRIVTYQGPNGAYYVSTAGAQGADCVTRQGWDVIIRVNGADVTVPAYVPGNPVEVIEAGEAALAHDETGWCNLMVCLGGDACEANCLDGQDNDGDNLSDCLDPDCHWFWSNRACP